MRFFGFLMFLCLWSTPMLADDTTRQPGQEQNDLQREAMEKLAEAGIREALKAIQRSGGFYSFGLVQDGDTVQAVGYSGKPEDAPDADEWSETLFWQLRDIGKKRLELDLMALVKLHEITNDKGKSVLGVWAEVDHREATPWIIFVPLVKNAEGNHEIGEPIYYPTEQPLFVENGEQE